MPKTLPPGGCLFIFLWLPLKHLFWSAWNTAGQAGGLITGREGSVWCHDSDLMLVALEGNLAFLKGLSLFAGHLLMSSPASLIAGLSEGTRNVCPCHSRFLSLERKTAYSR